MSYTYPTSQYPAVRAAVGLAVDDTALLPNETLGLSIYKGEAERFIERSLSATQYGTPEVANAVAAAATLYLASLVAPTIQRVQSERIAGGNISYSNISESALAKTLESRANTRIAAIRALFSTAPQTSPNPNIFAAVGPYHSLIFLSGAPDSSPTLSPSTGFMPWQVQNSDFVAEVGQRYQVDTSGGAIVATMPAVAEVGDEIQFQDATLLWATNPLTLAYNGTLLNSTTTDYLCDAVGGEVYCVYISDTFGWSIK